jgi:hypothetical protein
MGAWGIKALERDEGLDVLDILQNEYVPEHPVMDLGEMIELMKEEVMLGSDFLTNRLPLRQYCDGSGGAVLSKGRTTAYWTHDHEVAIWDTVRQLQR